MRYPVNIATGTASADTSFPAKRAIIANIQNVIPPIIRGLNFIMKPERNVGIAASVSIYGATNCILPDKIMNNTTAAIRKAIHVQT